ncbi:hypothetical protein [Streptomyces sp. KR80]|uniref:hypothetical protein n=1 Tax=Streptomyces sp. KR80 TaxID=3457426 RepID=UPI003FD69A15
MLGAVVTGVMGAAPLGEDGVLIVHEPDYSAGSFGRRFTRPELTAAFSEEGWQVPEDDAIELHAIDPESDADALRLPGYYAVLRRRPMR